MDALTKDLLEKAKAQDIKLSDGEGLVDDVLTYALFQQIGLKFLKNRNNPSAFEPVPTGKEKETTLSPDGEAIYTVSVEGKSYTVTVNDGGDLTGIVKLAGEASADGSVASEQEYAQPVPAPLAGNIIKIIVKSGQQVKAGDKIILLEAMKMETDITAPCDGVIQAINVREGDSVAVGDLLTSIK